METVGEWLKGLRLALARNGVEAARQEAALLLSARCGLSLARIYSHPEQPVTSVQADQLHEDLRRRLEHEPLAYILGQAPFYGLEFAVGPGVLIPRADSERLVEVALEQIEAHFPPEQCLYILDTCAGSGCVGISVAIHLQAKKRPFVLDLVEWDATAISYVRANVERHQLAQHAFVWQADLWPDPILTGRGHYDVITANPPYITRSEIPGLMPDVRCFEPWLALDGGSDGLDFYRRLTGTAGQYLARPGLLLFEHGFDQAQAVDQLCAVAGFQDRLAVYDYGGHPRVTGGWLQES